MYGVQKQVKDYAYIGEPPKWVQVLPPKGKGARRGKKCLHLLQRRCGRWLKEVESRF